MLNLTNSMLNQIAPGGDQTIVTALVPYLNQYLPQYGITTLIRLKHFFGQAAEECDSFKTLTEYASGAEYEGRVDLGNTQPGDGVKFKGRGIFQLTGRTNYTHVGEILGIDLVNNPALAATPEVAVQTACVYWQTHNLNALCDSPLSPYDTCVAVTEKINGATNGLSVRWLFTQRATTVLANVVNTTTTPVVQVVPILAANTEPAVFTTPVVKPVEQAVVNTVNTSPTSNVPIIYAVQTIETWIKKFF